jgi:WD40 repeat protein/serine/threonine protein kinase
VNGTISVVASGEPMTSSDQTPNPEHSLNHQVDAICKRFEAAWMSGSVPRIEDFLESLPGDTESGLLLELVILDVHHRSKQGESLTSAEYAKRFPEQAVLIRDHLDSLIQPKAQKRNAAPIAPTMLEPAVKPPAESSSRRVGPYKLLQLIGEGGMGAVYMADQLEPVKRRVALKLIKSGMDSKQVVARFEAERQALAMMDHQNIAKVLDAGITDDGTPYFAMELVQGMPITKYCDREKLSIPDRLKLFVQVCRALQHAHQKGVIHRDIKPTNVLVTQRDGVPIAKVIDFGLAKAMQNELRLTDKTLFTEVGQVCGTLEYMSPEQAEMNELGLDTRTDVYSLGVLLYELLTGSTPLCQDRIRKEAFHRVLQLILTEETPRPSRRLSDSGEAITGISDQRRIEPRRLSGILKRELDWIALKALEKDRNRRYDGAGTLADDVQHYLDGGVVAARPPSTVYRLRKAIRKHKAAFLSGTIFMLLLLAGLIGTGSMWIQARQEAARAAEAESRGIEDARSAYNSDMLVAQLDWETNNISHFRKILEGHRHRDDLKGFEWGYWDRVSHTETLTFKGHMGPVERVRFSPDGKWIVSGSGDKEVKVWDAITGQTKHTLEGHTDGVDGVSFSPDGKRIVSADGNGVIKLWDAETGQETRTFNRHNGTVLSLDFSPDGKRIVSGGWNRQIKLWDAETGEELLQLNGHLGWVYSVSFSPDGKHFVSSGGNSEIKLWDSETGQETRRLLGDATKVYSVSFSPDGKKLVSGGNDGAVQVWDISTGQKTLTFKGHSDFVTSVSFSPDGKRIVSGSTDKSVKLWDAQTGREMLTFKGHSDTAQSVRFSPDGRRIVSGSLDGTLKMWDAQMVPETVTYKPHSELVVRVAFSSDGQQVFSGSGDQTVKLSDVKTGQSKLILQSASDDIATSVNFNFDCEQVVSGSQDGTVKVWDVATGQRLRTLIGHSRAVGSVAFSPDSKRIVSGSEDGTLKVWDVASGHEMLMLKGHSGVVWCVLFSPGGTRIVSGSQDRTARIWDAASGHVISTFGGHTGTVESVAFSPDGQWIASGSYDKSIKLWDAKTGQNVLTIEDHAGPVNSVSFSPDGKRIVSGSIDNSIKLWDAKTGQKVLTLNGQSNGVKSVSFSPDGKRIVSGNMDGTLNIWDSRPRTTER